MGFLTFRIKYCLQEGLKHPVDSNPARNVMVIRDQCHTNACEHRAPFDYVNVITACCPITIFFIEK